jgi:hypothetical protein
MSPFGIVFFFEEMVSEADLLKLFRQMEILRRFEEKAAVLDALRIRLTGSGGVATPCAPAWRGIMAPFSMVFFFRGNGF